MYLVTVSPADAIAARRCHAPVVSRMPAASMIGSGQVEAADFYRKRMAREKKNWLEMD
jgi:hypothetical protein